MKNALHSVALNKILRDQMKQSLPSTVNRFEVQQSRYHVYKEIQM